MTIFIAFFIINIAIASAEVSLIGNKIFGCDNNNFCSLIIFHDIDADNGKSKSFVDDTNWYIKYDWNSNETFSLKLNLMDGRHSIPKLVLMNDKNEKLNVNLNNDGDVFSAKIEGFSIKNFNSFTLNFDNKTFTEDMSLPNNFNENNVSKRNDKTYYAHRWYNYRLLSKKEKNVLLNKYAKDSIEICYGSDNNFTFKIDNIGEFFVLCSDTGYNYSVTLWRKVNGKLEPYDFENDTSDLGVDGYISNNNITGFSLAQDDPYKFYVIFKGRHTGDCGGTFTFIFDGERFRLVRDEEMPICLYIYDWIKNYDIPFKKYQ